jgi:exonuclease III
VAVLATKETCPDDVTRYVRLQWLAGACEPLRVAPAPMPAPLQPAELAQRLLGARALLARRFSRCIRNLLRQARHPKGILPAIQHPPGAEEPPAYVDVAGVIAAAAAANEAKAAVREEELRVRRERKAKRENDLMRSGQPVLMKPGAALGIASFNARTMMLAGLSPHEMAIGDDHSITPLIDFCKKRGVDVLSVQEHRWNLKEPVIVNRDGWLFYFGPAPKGLGGVAVLLSPRLAESAVVTVLSDRLMAATFPVANGEALVLCTYAPTAMNAKDQSDHRRAITERARKHVSGPLFIAGDLNAVDLSLGRSHQLSDVRMLAATGLLELMEDLKLCSAGSQERFLPLPATFGHKGWADPARSEGAAVTLDHVLVPRGLARHVKVVEVPAAPTESDHRPLVVKISVRRAPKPPKGEKRPPALDFSAIQRCAEVAEALDAELGLVEGATWKEVSGKVLEVVGRVVPKREKMAKLVVVESEATQLARELLTRAQLPEDFCDGSRQSVKVAFARLRAAEQADVMTTVNDLCDVIDEALIEDPERAFKMVKRIITPQTRVAVVAASSPEDRKSTIAAVCAKQLQRPPGEEPDVHFDRIDGLAFNEAEFTVGELDAALRATTSGKAVGCDQLPAEVLKRPALQAHLLRVFNQCLASGTVPDDWHIVDFAMIPKAKGALTSAENWRYIALLCVVAKVYDRLLLARVAPLIDPVLRFNQNGFRKGRGTLQHIMAWHSVLDAAKYQGMPLAAGFIDFTNAFPSVSWKAINAALLAYGVPQTLRSAIMSMYDGPRGRVKTSDGPTDPFPITQGVMQGDTLAPFLFVSVLNLVLRDAIEPLTAQGIIVREARGTGRATRHTQAEVRLTDMDYADDIVVLSHTVDGLRMLMEAVELRAATVGLKVNFKPGKTEYMVFNIPDAPPLVCNGKQVVLTDEYKYLGSMCSVKRHLAMRIAMAVKTNMKLTTLWRSSLPITTKLRLFRCLVEPVLLYGLQSMGLGEEHLRKLDGAFTSMLRHVHAPGAAHLAKLTVTQLYGDGAVPPISATIIRLHLSLLGGVARTGLPGAKLGVKQPAFYLHLWVAPAATGALRLQNRAPALVNTAVRFAGLDLDQLRREVLSSSVEDWKRFCSERAETRCITYGEAAADQGAKRSARRRLDEEVEALVAAHPADAQLSAEAVAARTVDNKLRLLHAHGVVLTDLVGGLAAAEVIFALPTGSMPTWQTVVVAATRASGKSFYEAQGDGFTMKQSAETHGSEGVAVLLLAVLTRCDGAHVRLDAAPDLAAQILRCLKPCRARGGATAENDGVEDSTTATTQATLYTALAARRAKGLALYVVVADTSQFLACSRKRSRGGTEPRVDMDGAERKRRVALAMEERKEREALRQAFTWEGRRRKGSQAITTAEHRCRFTVQDDEARAFASLLATATRSVSLARLAHDTHRKRCEAVSTAEHRCRIGVHDDEARAFASLLAKAVRSMSLAHLTCGRRERRTAEPVVAKSAVARAKKEVTATPKMPDATATRKEKVAVRKAKAEPVSARRREELVKVRRYTAAQSVATLQRMDAKFNRARRQADEKLRRLQAALDRAAKPSIAALHRLEEKLARARRKVWNNLRAQAERLERAKARGGAPVKKVLSPGATAKRPARKDAQHGSPTMPHSSSASSVTVAEPSSAASVSTRPLPHVSTPAVSSHVPSPDAGILVVRVPMEVAVTTLALALEVVEASQAVTSPCCTGHRVVLAKHCPFAILSVDGPALDESSPSTLKTAAFRRLMRLVHTDAGGCREHSGDAVRLIKEAREKVCRPTAGPREAGCPVPQEHSHVRMDLSDRPWKRRRRELDECPTSASSPPSTSTTAEPSVAPVAAAHGEAVSGADTSVAAPGHAPAASRTARLTARERVQHRQLTDPERSSKRRRKELAGVVDTAPLTEESQREFMRRLHASAATRTPWLVSTWSIDRDGPRQEWLGLATGRGGRYPQVRWMFRRACIGQRDVGAHRDSDGGWWLPLVDDDGDVADFTTNVPSALGDVAVHELAVYRCLVPVKESETVPI